MYGNELMQKRRALSKLLMDYDIYPFLTMKYLSEKQENSNDLSEFIEEYGFSFRDYELFSNICIKQENNDKSFISDIESAINAMKNSSNKYIQEVYKHIPINIMKESLLNDVIKNINGIPPEQLRVFFSKSPDVLIRMLNRNYYYSLNKLVCKLAQKNHKISKIYSPYCGNASIIPNLDKFDEAVLYETDSHLYLQAIQNVLINDIPLDTITIKREEAYLKDFDAKYDTIISIPLIGKKLKKIENLPNYENYKKFISKKYETLPLVHMLEHLDDNGMIITLIPHKILSDSEFKELREFLINNNMLEAVIEFQQRTIHDRYQVMIIIKKQKENEDFLFIKKPSDRRTSRVWLKLIDKIYLENLESHYSNWVTKEKIIKNNYNLNPKRYVYTLEYEVKDMAKLVSEQKEYTNNIRQLDEQIDELFEDFDLNE